VNGRSICLLSWLLWEGKKKGNGVGRKIGEEATGGGRSGGFSSTSCVAAADERREKKGRRRVFGMPHVSLFLSLFLSFPFFPLVLSAAAVTTRSLPLLLLLLLQ
jgi:hypothetical protein